MAFIKILLDEKSARIRGAAEWARRTERIINHPENLEPLLERMHIAFDHWVAFGHIVDIQEHGINCPICGVVMRY